MQNISQVMKDPMGWGPNPGSRPDPLPTDAGTTDGRNIIGFKDPFVLDARSKLIKTSPNAR